MKKGFSILSKEKRYKIKECLLQTKLSSDNFSDSSYLIFLSNNKCYKSENKEIMCKKALSGRRMSIDKVKITG